MNKKVIDNIIDKLDKLEKNTTEAISGIRKRVDIWVEDITKNEIKGNPYLIKGAICEVWTKNYQERVNRFFREYDSEGFAVFNDHFDMIDNFTCGIRYPHYKIKGTIWDFAPEWANWYAVDQNENAYFYKSKPILGDNCWRATTMTNYIHASNDHRVKDWKESLIERPYWG